MTASELSTEERYWLGAGRRLCMLVRLGWWWRYFAKGLLLGAMGVAPVIYAVRLREGAWELVLLAGGVLALLWAGVAYGGTRRRAFPLVEALSRLDVAAGEHHRRVSAYAGIGPWPPVPASLRLPLQWETGRMLPPVLLTALLLLTAGMLPLPRAGEAAAVLREPPSVWGDTERLVEALRQDELVQEEALLALEEQVAALRELPPETWYRQGTMETTEQLRQQVTRDARQLQRALEETAAMLALVADQRDQLTPEMQTQLGEWLQERLQELAQGSLPLDAALLAQLQELDMGQLPQLSAEQLQELADRLGEACDQMGMHMEMAGFGEAGGEGEDALAALLAALQLASGQPGEDDQPSPLTFLEAGQDRLQAGERLALSNPDLRQAALGDQIGVAEGEHEVEPVQVQGAGGGLLQAGGGGEAVWRQEVLPQEAQWLQDYFQPRRPTHD